MLRVAAGLQRRRNLLEAIAQVRQTQVAFWGLAVKCCPTTSCGSFLEGTGGQSCCTDADLCDAAENNRLQQRHSHRPPRPWKSKRSKPNQRSYKEIERCGSSCSRSMTGRGFVSLSLRHLPTGYELLKDVDPLSCCRARTQWKDFMQRTEFNSLSREQCLQSCTKPKRIWTRRIS